ncbi:MAG: B12-binding domain-containing protein [Syntrophobacteraceae bacterium]
MAIEVKAGKTVETKGQAAAPMRPELEKLSQMVAELREEEVLALIREYIDAQISTTEIFDACQKGMRMVGSLHAQGRYFIAGLIMAGEIMRQVVELLHPILSSNKPRESIGRVLLGTIKGDIHDVGKNLFKQLLECHGFTVLDLGVDVSPGDFIHATLDFNPHLIAVSVLITDSFPFLYQLVKEFHTAMPDRDSRPVIMIGGGQVDERIFRASGSDYWAQDAFSGLKLCLDLIADHNPSHAG